MTSILSDIDIIRKHFYTIFIVVEYNNSNNHMDGEKSEE